ncbi:hypothetical protein NC00_04675 [Xanthomonas cannabis pv. phaseoli]|uniref:Secreted protein n=1 Tax=Xanthomonas cannabis pv. phaseoli TaxID=1885902 RepID=A0AB34PBU2_9XANT|nr:hypothetical protein NC00_04675 [Xanthomonas cannabis pv. phaseoli]
MPWCIAQRKAPLARVAAARPPAGPHHPGPPACAHGVLHLLRWHGHAAVQVGAPRWRRGTTPGTLTPPAPKELSCPSFFRIAPVARCCS